ncbi:exocyst subunit [Martiniozyma asiatica (nom. inval.)]|nr:exocyst subunit [Martiniozyma asiatica]
MNSSFESLHHRRRFSVRGAPPTIGGDLPPLPLSHGDLPSMLKDPSFDPAGFVDRALLNASLPEFAHHSEQLAVIKSSNEVDLHAAISSSLTEVLKVSQAVSDTKQSLQQMKPLVDQLSSLLEQQLDQAYASPQQQFANNRQSMLFLQTKWSQAMRSLFVKINHAQDILPSTNASTRRIIVESKKWWEMNPITLKALRPLHIVLFNDCIMIAVRDKGKSKKSTATHCYPLTNLIVFNGRNVSSLENSEQNELYFMIKSGGSSHLLRTDRESEVGNWITQIKETKNALNAKRHSKHQSWSLSIDGRLSSPTITNDVPPDMVKILETNLESIEDSFTSLSLTLALKNLTASVGFIKSLEEELSSLLTITTQDAEFNQHVNLVHQVKLEQLNEIKNKLRTQITNEITRFLTTKKASSLVELLNLLNPNYIKEAQAYWLNLRARELSNNVSQLRVGSTTRTIPSSIPPPSAAPNTPTLSHRKRESLNTNTPLSPSVGTFSSPIQHAPSLSQQLPVTAGPEGQMPADIQEPQGVSSQIITTYIRELSLIYIGTCLKVWKEYKVFDQGMGLVVRWIGDRVTELRARVAAVLVDYRGGGVWDEGISVVKDVMSKLEDVGLQGIGVLD